MKLTHPCKDTCSGYSQDCAEQIEHLQARVKEFEAENEALVEGSCLAEFNGYKRMKEENARLRTALQEIIASAEQTDHRCYYQAVAKRALREVDGECAIPHVCTICPDCMQKMKLVK